MYIGKLDGHHTTLNVNNINQTAAKNNEALDGTKKKEEEQKDTITLSPVGKKQSILEQLMKQKEYLQEKKQSILDSIDQNGSSGINEQLKEVESQMKELDNQIVKLQTDQTEETNSDDDTGKIYDKPKTKDEAQIEQLNQITQLSSNNDQSTIIYSEKKHIDGKINILEAEISSGRGNIEKKIEDVSNLKSKSQELSTKIADQLKDTSDTIKVIKDDVEDIKESDNKKSNTSIFTIQEEANTPE